MEHEEQSRNRAEVESHSGQPIYMDFLL